MIEGKNIWKSFGEDTILERLNFKVKKGEFVTLVGTSGCGKSTLLNMLLGTSAPTKGKLLLDGEAIPDQPNADRGIVFQHYSVFPHMTVLENVVATRGFQKKGVTGYLFGSDKKKAVAEAKSMLEQVGLTHVFNKYPNDLSGGMRQRLAIAQTLLANPRVLLLDEPFGALDPGIRAEMHELVLSLWKEHQLTVFMVTHDLKEGFYLGTRLWVLDKVRLDPTYHNAYGANITYDLPVGQNDSELYQDIKSDLNKTLAVMP
jgi:NitT/TauT family transport system ATP-binding protein